MAMRAGLGEPEGPFLHPKKGITSGHCGLIIFYHDMLRLTSSNFGALALSPKGSSKSCPGQLMLRHIRNKSDASLHKGNLHSIKRCFTLEK